MSITVSVKLDETQQGAVKVVVVDKETKRPVLASNTITPGESLRVKIYPHTCVVIEEVLAGSS